MDPSVLLNHSRQIQHTVYATDDQEVFDAGTAELRAANVVPTSTLVDEAEAGLIRAVQGKAHTELVQRLDINRKMAAGQKNR